MEYLIFDTESCTGRSNDGSLCSIGLVVCDENFNIIKREDILCNPLPKRFTVGDKKNLKRTGISFAYTVDEFRKAPKFCDIYSKIKMFFKNRTVLGFSLANDVKYLNDACDKYGLERITYDFLDIQFIYQLIYNEQNSVGLKRLADKYGIDYLEHRSDEDAVVSAKLLKAVLSENGLTLDEVIEKYGIHKGRNLSNGHYNNFSDALFGEKFGLKRSKKMQSSLLYEYMKKLPRKAGKKVCFSSKIERSDVNYVRTLIDLLYEKGYAYTSNADVCSVFVTDGEKDAREEIVDKIKRRKIYKVPLAEFERDVGYSENFVYNDVPLLDKFSSRLVY
ncbi:MAG TPA: hypothetical protein DDW54_02770 [Clostridiales bacterium]|nr:hypothetical protein [Clostridiales bacterium]